MKHADYSKLTVLQLKEVLKSKNISFDGKIKKKDLIQMLEEDLKKRESNATKKKKQKIREEALNTLELNKRFGKISNALNKKLLRKKATFLTFDEVYNALEKMNLVLDDESSDDLFIHLSNEKIIDSQKVDKTDWGTEENIDYDIEKKIDLSFRSNVESLSETELEKLRNSTDEEINNDLTDVNDHVK